MYGISTDKTIGIHNPHGNNEFRSYYSNNGHIWQNGGSRGTFPITYDGNTLTIIADLIGWTITW